MVTFVGTQGNFSDALKELVELEYAALDAYEAAVSKIEKSMYKEKLKEFMQDHQRHLKELSALLRSNKYEVPEKGVLGKQLLTTGKVLLANMVGDHTILEAMKSNEIDTNTAYEKMNSRKDKWPGSEDIIKKGLQDEKRHKAWLEGTLS